MIRRCYLLAATLVVVAMQPVNSALAQEVANRPIKFIVPFTPGSGTDTSARYFGRKLTELTELTGQPVVVDNNPGANGFIAVQAVLQAPADGPTVFVGSNSTLAVNIALFKSLPYNPQVDFMPLSMMMRAPTVVVVPQQSPYKTLADLIAAAKAQPGKLNHAGGSAGYQAGLPGFGAYVWVGAMVSAKTHKPQAERLASLLAQTERAPETKAFYERINGLRLLKARSQG